MEESMSRVYHIIDSIKGGCGKTTFAIMLTGYLESQYRKEWELEIKKRESEKEESKSAKEEKKSGEKECKHACLLDVDFVGTGMIDLFMNAEGKKEFLDKNIYLTEKIRGFQVEGKRYISQLCIGGEKLHIGFGDPEFRTKEKFRCSSKYNYTTVVGYGIFRSGIKSILKEGALEEQIKGTVRSVVLDMSPGLDAYSETVKECVFDKRHSSILAPSDKRNYYLMVGMDYSHLSSAKDYFSEFLKGEDRKSADNIFIVFDDVLQFFAGKPGENLGNIEEEIRQYNVRIANFCETLVDIPEELRKKIHFLVINPFYKYSEILHNLDHLCVLSEVSKEEEKIFEKCPFRFAALGYETEKGLYRIKEEIKEKEQWGKILKWMI